MTLVPLDRAGADAGAKAAHLATLRRAGLPVPDGFVIPPVADRAFPPGLAAELLAAAGSLGTSLVVRSSSACEDGAVAAAPGVFRSLRDVAPASVPAAVLEVWDSAVAPGALAYLARRRLGPDAVRMAVLVQTQVDGVRGTLYTRLPAQPASAVMLAEEEPVQPPRLLARDGADPLVALGLAVEEVLGGPADIEWVRDRAGGLWVVQARPLRFAVVHLDEFLHAAAPLDQTRLWSWDAAHNPEPLSPAQEGLVAAVEAEGLGTVHQVVLLGFLYTSPRTDPPPVAFRPEELRDAWERLRPAWLARLAAAEGRGLAAAVAAYLEVYRGYAGEWGASLAAARRAFADELAGLGVPPTTSAMPRAWDVAAPLTPPPFAPVPTPPRSLPETIAALSEEDDQVFAAAQTLVRTALAALAPTWGLSLEEICHLPLAEVLASGAPPADARARAAAAIAERARRQTLVPPARLSGGHALAPPHDGDVLRGTAASPGWALGVVCRSGSPHRAEGILVVPALVPGTYADAMGAAAIVTEHGGILSHGAALARELRIPCVVGCPGARELRDGERIWVDGDRGWVWRAG